MFQGFKGWLFGVDDSESEEFTSKDREVLEDWGEGLKRIKGTKYFIKNGELVSEDDLDD